MDQNSAEKNFAGRMLCVVISIVVGMVACSHDWDFYDPEQSTGTPAGTGGSSASTGASTSSSGSGGGQPCTANDECTSSNPCVSGVCQNGMCNTTNHPDDTLIAAGNGTNCLDTVCQNGQPTSEPNFQRCNDPIPNNCLVPFCDDIGGCHTNQLMNAPQGYPCQTGTGMAGTCDGNGNCI